MRDCISATCLPVTEGLVHNIEGEDCSWYREAATTRMCMVQGAHQLGVEGGARAFLQHLLCVFRVFASDAD